MLTVLSALTLAVLTRTLLTATTTIIRGYLGLSRGLGTHLCICGARRDTLTIFCVGFSLVGSQGGKVGQHQ
jgi:hypothetical protein